MAIKGFPYFESYDSNRTENNLQTAPTHLAIKEARFLFPQLARAPTYQDTAKQIRKN
jgi:hypothetical protein